MKDMLFKISGQIVDVVDSRLFPGTITVKNGKIIDIEEISNFDKLNQQSKQIIMPGLIDSHVHIESSMLVPSEFARLAVVHGTVATVSDPHEIANILGIKGIQYMIENGRKVPFKFYFSVPSCVPATPFETSGAILDANDMEILMAKDEIKYMGEMMNYPGVLSNDEETYKKLEAAKRHHKPVDGHAPGLTGDKLVKYYEAGISTDHECYTFKEGREKAALGMKIEIREGSAAHNFDTLIPLMNECPEELMFCSDDKHPDDLVKGHINEIIKRAIALGYNIMDIIKAATVNPVRHYNLEVGLIRKNDPADFIVVDNFNNFNILQTYINGQLVAENGKTLIPHIQSDFINNFVAGPVKADDFKVKDEGKSIRIIDIVPDQVITNELIDIPKILDGNVVSDTERDILKIAVINRYQKSKPAIGFVKNFGLKTGAIASSINHDNHNIIVVGCSDKEIAEAVNQIVTTQGGISAWSEKEKMTLPLPVAGLMSNDDGYKVAADYQAIDTLAKNFGATLHAPFMTLSFMSLLVIPNLKLSDKGLFDGKNFRFTTLFVE